MRRIGLVFLLSAFLALAGDNQNKDPEAIGQRKVDGGVNFYSIEKEIAPYAGEKGNLRFPLDEPIPYGLIERIAKLRVAQVQTKMPKRKKP